MQFLVFLISLALVTRTLVTSEGAEAALDSVVVKTALLYLIMVTGCLWEHDVYGRYLFAPAFFWEDAVSMVVIALHSAYLIALVTGDVSVRHQLLIALAAYGCYLLNAIQFLLKLRAARKGSPRTTPVPLRPALQQVGP